MAMTDLRWKELMADDELPLSVEELGVGWHWCDEFDGLLVGPEMGEWDCCLCDCVAHLKK